MNPEDLIPEDLQNEQIDQEEETLEDEEEILEEDDTDEPAPAPAPKKDTDPDTLAALIAAIQNKPAPATEPEDEDAYLSPAEIMRRVKADVAKEYGTVIAQLKDQVEKPSVLNQLSARAEIDPSLAQSMFGDMSAQDLNYLMQKPGFIDGLKALRGPAKKSESSKKPLKTGAKPAVSKPKGVTIPEDLRGILEGYAKTYGKNSPEYKARYEYLMSQENN